MLLGNIPPEHLATHPANSKQATPVEIEGQPGLQIGDQLFKIQKMKPWKEMTKEEQDQIIQDGANFIMGD